MKRPYEVTVIGWLFIAVGVLALAFHLTRVPTFHPFPVDMLEIFVVELLALVSGLYILRGHNWARWLAVLWMAAHAIGSFVFLNRQAALAHTVLTALIAYALFRPQSTAYFRAPKLL
jgi:hypothetical protein